MSMIHARAAPSALPFITLLASVALVTSTSAQPLPQPLNRPLSFSIDWQSPPVGALDSCFMFPITEGDILAPAFFGPPLPGPAPLPCIQISGGFGPPMPGLALPTHPPGVGHPPGFPARIEVDAISFGTDQVPTVANPNNTYVEWYFSVDEFATGIMGTLLPPAVWTESWLGGPAEASADIFVDFGVPGFVPAPILAPRGNHDLVDGNGIPPFGGPGLGLIEPNPPTPQMPADPGTNIDAIDIDSPVGPGIPFPVYYSLDSMFLDPMEGFPNSGTAMALGFVGGDVLVCMGPGAPPMLYAPAPLLGLDLFGPDTDDLDALVLRENGTGVFEPPLGLFSWRNGLTDAIFFSVRRGSALVMNKTPDSRWGIPIEEGDILMPPPQAGMPPRMWIPAEMLGLATFRSGTAVEPYGDDLDALDVACRIPGDLDRDGDVDINDLAILLAAYGVSAGGDLNGDGATDLTDLAMLLSQFGLIC